ncbi:MAG: carbohydrate-binding protein [Bacteroidales bacterium]|nr:carbohydrate-binding protein [Bacteroidales bacterium]
MTTSFVSFEIKQALRSAGILVFLLIINVLSAQNLKTSGKKIVDEAGNEVILRGMGLGGWMLMEGYMMETSSFANPQREIKAKIQSLIGPQNTENFYKTWHQNHCTKTDIDSLASWGFNSVRLPMHYNLYTLPIEAEPVAGENTWLEEGFTLTDSLLKWCSENQIYLILDLHAAPGGQGKDMAISDYDPAKPSLWESEANKQKTIALWRKLAERYANEPWMGGYDLINETNWNFTAGANQNGCSESSNVPLRQLLVAITQAIREVDQQHMIIIEGNCWANNYNGLLPPWDNNMVASFHKYWSTNDQNSIQGMINIRNTHNIPLWLGESGENSNHWFTDAIQLCEKNSIGWCWWPMKKVSSVVNPLTIPKNSDYQVLLDYWQNGGATPGTEFAKNAMMQLAENSKIENCIFRKDIIDAMFRQVNDASAKPYANHHIPGLIHFSDFDMGKNGVAYKDKEFADYHVSSGTYTSWNNGWVYRNDGVDVETCFDSDPQSNDYNVGWTEDTEWIQYTVQIDSSAAYNMDLRYASSSLATPRIRIKSNGSDISGTLMLTSTGGNQTWKTLQAGDLILYKGINQLQVYIDKGGANLGYMRFSLSKKIEDVPLRSLSAETYQETQDIYLTLNKSINPATISSTGFEGNVNGQTVSVSSVKINSLNPQQLIIRLSEELMDGDNIKLNYSGSGIMALDESLLATFTDLQVINNLPVHLAVPGKIEAEAFSYNRGLQLETTTDAGGGQNIGYTNTGDFLDYKIRVSKSGTYTLDARVACQSSAGILEFQQLDKSGTLLNSATLDVPVTGGWQTWATHSVIMNLNEGMGILRVKIMKPEFNINWYRFTKIAEEDTVVNPNKNIRIFPNPLNKNENKLKIEMPESKGNDKTLSIMSLNGALLRQETLESADENYTIMLNTLSSGLYILELTNGNETWRSKLTIL